MWDLVHPKHMKDNIVYKYWFQWQFMLGSLGPETYVSDTPSKWQTAWNHHDQCKLNISFHLWGLADSSEKEKASAVVHDRGLMSLQQYGQGVLEGRLANY